ncbi:MAG TPA: DUF5996 family protein [Rubrobacteraceae bacterium]|nr:DUF5996 family protein [Rubrobacteraceae bacterium]
MRTPAGRFAAGEVLPPLPLEAWEESKETLHRYVQVVGKVRMELSPYRNHWWHVTLYVTPRGLSTGPIPYRGGSFEISFDLLDSGLVVGTSAGGGFAFPFDDLPVARFYRNLFDGLRTLGIEASINPNSFDLGDESALDENTVHCVCDRESVRRYARALVAVDHTLKRFAGRFLGKQSPVQLFWHSFDLALNRFSGRRVPERVGADPVTREAYSHELISFGFWPGDRNVRAPAFYSYTAPEPTALTGQPLRPPEASWSEEGGTALLMYDDVRRSDSPAETLLDFLESAYLAGARTAGWDVEGLRAQDGYREG